MIKTTDQILLEAIRGSRADIARIDRDLAKDRQGNENMAMAVNANTEQVNQFGKRLEIIEKKIQDKVAEAVAPAMEQVQDFKDVMIDKKVTAIDAKKTERQIKPWWKVWR